MKQMTELPSAIVSAAASSWLFAAILIFAWITPSASFARNEGPVYHVGSGLRSVPLGGASYVGGGYDQRLWGDASQEHVMYGYVRPSFEWTVAPSLHALETKISIFPVSFFGLSLGRLETYRNSSTSLNVECTQLECGGRLRADFLSAELSLGANGCFYVTQFDWRNERPERDRFDFYEDSLVLPGHRGADQAFTHSHTIGRKFDGRDLKSLAIGLHFRRSELRLSGASSERYGIVAAASQGDFQVNSFVGLYQSAWRGLQPTIGVSLEWSPESGLSL